MRRDQALEAAVRALPLEPGESARYDITIVDGDSPGDYRGRKNTWIVIFRNKVGMFDHAVVYVNKRTGTTSVY
jgi:hypothetical protein